MAMKMLEFQGTVILAIDPLFLSQSLLMIDHQFLVVDRLQVKVDLDRLFQRKEILQMAPLDKVFTKPSLKSILQIRNRNINKKRSFISWKRKILKFTCAGQNLPPKSLNDSLLQKINLATNTSLSLYCQLTMINSWFWRSKKKINSVVLLQTLKTLSSALEFQMKIRWPSSC